MEITCSGVIIGHIKQKCHCFPVFQICDPDENIVLEIKGPLCPISCCGNVDFEVSDLALMTRMSFQIDADLMKQSANQRMQSKHQFENQP